MIEFRGGGILGAIGVILVIVGIIMIIAAKIIDRKDRKKGA